MQMEIDWHNILGIIARTALATTAQLVVALPTALLCWYLYLVTRRVRARVGYKADTFLAGWLGTPVHELSHAALCLAFNHKIRKIRFYAPNSKDGTLGSVDHSFDRGSLWQRLGQPFIALAPIFGGSMVLLLAAWLLLGVDLMRVAENAPAFRVHSAAQFFEVVGSWFSFLPAYYRAVEAAASFSDWRFWAFSYVVFAVGSHLAPSPADMKDTGFGILIMVCGLFLLNLFSLWFQGLLEAVHWLAGQAAFINALLLFPALLCGFTFLVVEGVSLLRKML